MHSERELNSTVFNILIVDDFPLNLQVLGAILGAEGYNVRPVPNGRLALRVAEKEKPDLILLDIMMPEMDGFEVCRQLKESQDLRDIPVIFISALNETSDIVRALKSGGVDYITKPFQIKEVTARVSTHLQIHQQRKEIEWQRRELQILNAEKDKFYSIIAHDLRSPFMGFLGMTRILDEELPCLEMAEVRNTIKDMRSSAETVYGLLEDLLQWARMEQGLIPFNPEEVQLRPIVDESMVTALEPAVMKGVEIIADVPDHLLVFADVNIVQTVIRNLVSNAVKFTPKGGKVTISARATGGNTVEISVKDSGIGMSRAMVDVLFRFGVETNRQGTEGEPSTGLGLIICKDLVEKHGGKLRAESEEGKGSDFTFTLPSPI
jgi:two-component system sensor histidine kinase/response regulator